MSRPSTWIGFALLVAIGLGLSYLGWRMAHSPQAAACDACGRPLHAHSQTVGIVGEQSQVFCCPTCALTLHRQTGQAVRIAELTDFETRERISPDDAYLVTDSEVNLCMRHQVLTDEHKEASRMEFDRCSPSMIAFSSEEAAERFQGEHGGVVLPFRQAAKAYEPAPSRP